MEQRYPKDTVANIGDFQISGWQDVIASGERSDYPGMSRSFASAAIKALQEGNAPRAKLFWLLADACSMRLKPASLNEPFKPLWLFEGGARSTLPEDFSEADVELALAISEVVDQPWLKARLADICWLLRRPRNPAHAFRAIDAYRAVVPDAETWNRGGHECWQRAITLTQSLGIAAGDRITRIELRLLEAFRSAAANDDIAACRRTFTRKRLGERKNFRNRQRHRKDRSNLR